MSFPGSKLRLASPKGSELPSRLDTGSGRDLKEALVWYERINPDLALRLLVAVESAVEVIADHPLRFQTVHNQIRRTGIRRFPYGIFFQAEKRRIVVLACMHLRRNPKKWKTRHIAN